MRKSRLSTTDTVKKPHRINPLGFADRPRIVRPARDTVTETAALARMDSCTADAAMTIVLLDETKDQAFVPSNYYRSPNGYYMYEFWGYKIALFDPLYSPGTYVTSTRYVWKTTLYDLRTRKKFYAAQTTSFDRQNAIVMAGTYGKTIVNNMIRRNVLHNKFKVYYKAF